VILVILLLPNGFAGLLQQIGQRLPSKRVDGPGIPATDER